MARSALRPPLLQMRTTTLERHPQLSEPATASPSAAAAAAMEEEADATPTKLDAPSGLVQSYALIPTRHRLTALLALIRSRCASSTTGGGSACKMIVFVSSCDQVDFLYDSSL